MSDMEIDKFARDTLHFFVDINASKAEMIGHLLRNAPSVT